MSYHNIPTKKKKKIEVNILKLLTFIICYNREKLTNSEEFPTKDLLYKVTGMRTVYPCRLKSIVHDL